MPLDTHMQVMQTMSTRIGGKDQTMSTRIGGIDTHMQVMQTVSTRIDPRGALAKQEN